MRPSGLCMWCYIGLCRILEMLEPGARMVKPKFKPLGKPAKRLNTVRTRSTRGNKTVTVQVPFEIEHGRDGYLIPAGLGLGLLHPGPDASTSGDLDDINTSDKDNRPTQKVSKHHEKRIVTANKWASLRDGLINGLLRHSYPASFSCCLCDHKPQQGWIYRCSDCGPMSYFCQKCCIKQHQSSLHSIEVWSPEDGFFRTYWLPTLWKRLDGHSCPHTYEALIIVINDRGQQRLQKMELCPCQERALTLLGYDLWPASPDIPTIAFTLELMLTLRTLVLEGQLPLTAFCHGMQQYRVTDKTADWVADVARILRWEVLLNFMEVYHHTKFMQYAGTIYNPLECMACPPDDNERGKIVCMDGNFRLVHRKAAGGPPLQVRHQEGFFLPQADVDTFVSEHTAKRKPHTKMCSNFQADSIIRTKNKTDKLDVTGVFGGVCNHDFPQKFFNIRFGERMAYPVYLMSNIRNVKIMLYDIGCQLEAHLLKNNIPYSCHIGIGAFHIYGHQLACKLKYSPRTLDGAGLCDGEGAERLWSFLGRFSTISKEMTFENRLDVLNEALLHYGNRITLKLGTSLCQRLEKAYMLKDTSWKDLQNVITEHHEITLHTIGNWSASEKVEKRKRNVQVDWKVDYVLALFDFYEELKKVESTETSESDDGNIDAECEELDRLESRLLRIEKRHKLERWSADSVEFTQKLHEACEKKRQEQLEEVWDQVVEYKHMDRLKHKYAKGGSLAQRISMQTQKASKKLTESIKKYNSLPPHGPATVPHKIEREDVLTLESPIWLNINDNDTEGLCITGTEKRKCIDSYRLNKRAIEELKRTLCDMTALLENLEKRLLLIQRVLQDNHAIEKPLPLDFAIRAELKKHLISSKAEFERISAIFSKSSRPHVTDMVAFIELIEGNLAKRMLPTEQEGLTAPEISNILSDVEKIEEQGDDEEYLESEEDCER